MLVFLWVVLCEIDFVRLIVIVMCFGFEYVGVEVGFFILLCDDVW